MAFDLTKSLLSQTLPAAGPSRSVDKSSVAKANAKPEKAPFPGRSFGEELASETAKTTQPVSRREVVQAKPDSRDLPAANNSAVKEVTETLEGPAQKTVTEPDLDLLRMFGEGSEDDILESPVASLLAAGLQSVNPGELPELMKNNKFLSAALFGSDSASVLEGLGEPTELFEMLDLPQELISKLKELLSKDQNGQIDLAQVFASFGLDPAFVTSQINVLRAQLAPLLSGGSESKKIDPSVIPSAVTTVRTKIQSLPYNTESLFSANLEGVEPDDTGAVSAAAEGAVGVVAQGVGRQLLNQNSSGDLAQDLTAVKLPSTELFEGFKRWKDAVSTETNTSPAAALANPTLGSAVPVGKSATFDAFYELGQKIDQMSPEHVIKIDGSQIVEAVETAVKAPSFMETVINRFGMVGQLKPIEAKPAAMNGLGALATDAVVPADQNSNEQVQQAKNPVQIAGGIVAAVTQAPGLNPKNLIDTSARKFTVDELFGDVTAGRLNLDVVKNDTELTSDSEGGGLSQFSGEKFMGAAGLASHKPAAFGADFSAHMTQGAEANVMSSSQRAEMVQKVMDSASYLVRQGAGSVKLDLSSVETGSLQIAVSLLDNKVDIKIFTESDPVREAMVADLSRLKESLQAQNVNLNHVEVGVGQKFAGSGSSDQGRQFSQQQELQESFNNLRASFNDNLAKSVERPTIPAASIINRMNQISSDGRVQIRI